MCRLRTTLVGPEHQLFVLGRVADRSTGSRLMHRDVSTGDCDAADRPDPAVRLP
jgi:hypothetical protein